MLSKADILTRLRQEVMQMEGFRPVADGQERNPGLGRMVRAFPHGVFPRAAVHEFHCSAAEEAAAASGFICGLLSHLLSSGSSVIWIAPQRLVFPPALAGFGIDPAGVLFIEAKRERELAWILEEALKCRALSAVIGEVRDLDFTASRRLQLAVESSGVTGFWLRRQPRQLATASTARWKVTPLPSEEGDGLPGLGHPRWSVELLKVRNGQPGRWEVEWAHGGFRHPARLSAVKGEGRQKKTG